MVEGTSFLKAAKLLIQVYNFHLVDNVFLKRAASKPIRVRFPITKSERIQFVLGLVVYDVLVNRLTVHVLSSLSLGI